MYKLLVVDDEPQIVEWLYELFENEKSMELDVYKAYSGFEAIELLDKTRMDIVLTDIYMPGLTGLQLLDEIRDRWSHCQVIFLTGYSEFNYVYEAINKDCVSYILKTEDDEEIISAVRKAIDKVVVSTKNEEIIKKVKQQMQSALPLMQREYLNGIIKFGISAPELNQKSLDELEIPLRLDKPVIIVLGYISEIPERISTIERNKQISTIKMMIKEYLPEYLSSICVEYEYSTLLYIAQVDDESNKNIVKIKNALEIIQAACRTAYNILISFIIGNEFIGWNDIPQKISYLKQLLYFSSGVGNQMVITEKSFQQVLSSKKYFYKEDVGKSASQLNKIDLLGSYLERGQKDEFFTLFFEILDCLKNINSMNNPEALEIYYSVSLCLLSYINRWRLLDILAFRTGIYKLTRVEEHQSWKDAVAYLRQVAEELFAIQRSHQEKAVEDSISYLQNYIQDHYGEDLSLSRLGDLVYFNPSYLSRLFKQATGMNLSDYITDVRLIHAKKMLAETDVKINEIAVKVGFGTPTHFGRIFKKITNMTPQEYREKVYIQ